MSLPRKQKAVTLIELLIAITLLSVITIGLSSIDIFSRFHLLSSSRRAQLQNEASFVIEHMAKHISTAIGDFDNPAIILYPPARPGTDIRVKTDTYQNGRRDDDNTDFWIAYRYEVINNNPCVVFYENAGTQQTPNGQPMILSTHAVISPPGLTFDFLLNPNGSLADNNIGVQVTLRWDPANAASSDNPQVEMRSRIKMPSVSTN